MPKKKESKSTKKVATKKVVKKTAPKGYSLKIELNGEVFKKNTKTVAQTILAVNPTVVKGATKITLKKGKKSVERVIFAPAARRLFRNRIAAETVAKNLIRSLNG